MHVLHITMTRTNPLSTKTDFFFFCPPLSLHVCYWIILISPLWTVAGTGTNEWIPPYSTKVRYTLIDGSRKCSAKRDMSSSYYGSQDNDFPIITIEVLCDLFVQCYMHVQTRRLMCWLRVWQNRDKHQEHLYTKLLTA